MTENKARAREWKKFRRKFFFTQVRLADILGVSRRCVQNVEAGKVRPLASTLAVFEVLKGKHNGRKDDVRRGIGSVERWS